MVATAWWAAARRDQPSQSPEASEVGTGMNIGADIGKSADPTAVIAVECYRPERLSPREPWPEVRHRIRWIERVPLGTDYPRVVDKIASIAETAQANGWGNVAIVLDSTGVGEPVKDMLRRRTSISLRAITFTGAEKATKVGPYDWNVPKRDLVCALEVVMQTRRVECVPDCPLQQDLNAELSTFDFSISDRGHASFEASSGNHDDLVLALALAVYWGERPDVGAAYVEFVRQRTAGREIHPDWR